MNLGVVWTVLKEAGMAWNEVKSPRMAAALAFYTILSITPLVVIATAIAGAVFTDKQKANRAIQSQLEGMIGKAGSDVATTALEKNDEQPHTGVIATVISVVTLLVGASGVFGELQDSLNTAWKVKPREGRGVWAMVKDRFLSFGMVVVVGFLLLVSMLLSTGLQAAGAYMKSKVGDLPVVLEVVNVLVSFVVVTVLFALVFKVLPDVRIAWRDVWLGAAITAVLFTAGKYLIGLYIGNFGVATPYGAAGSLVAFVVWVYYSGLIVLFGAQITRLTAEHAGRSIHPTENAVKAEPDPSVKK